MKMHITRPALLWLIAGLFVVGGFIWFATTANDSNAEMVASPESLIQNTPSLPQDTFAYSVVGTVKAADEVVVQARQAGVVSELSVREGEVTESGAVLGVILDPVTAARLTVEEVAGLMMQLREESASVDRGAGATTAALSAATTAVVAETSLESAAHRKEAALASAALALEMAKTTVPAVLRFVQDNKTLFTSESLTVYRNSLDTFYGAQPSYLRIGPLLGGREGTALFSVLESSSTDSDTLRAVTNVRAALGDLRVVFKDSASEFLDRTNLASSDAAYQEYITRQQELLTLETTLLAAETDLVSATNASALTASTQAGLVATSEVAAAAAREQERVARELRAQSASLAAAQASVVRAGLSLGVERAPFQGTVRDVYVEAGENVQPGTPLMTLVGDGAREAVVSVPTALLSRVVVGQPLMVDGHMVGVVDRVAPSRASGSGEVFVTLEENIPVGTTLRGSLEVPLISTNERVVYRSYLGFSPTGPFVVTDSGLSVPVTVTYDAGEWLVVTGRFVEDAVLMPMLGIRL